MIQLIKSLPVYDQGQGLHVEVVLQLPLGVLQHLHGAFGLRQFCVQLGKVNLKLGDLLSQPVVLPGIVTVCLWYYCGCVNITSLEACPSWPRHWDGETSVPAGSEPPSVEPAWP